MPSVVAGAIVSAVGLSGIVATVATGALGAVVSMAVGSLTITSAKKRSSTLSAGERIEMLRSATTPRRVIYGQARVSGALVFATTTDLGAGKKNHVLHLVLALAGHEISDVGTVYVNDEAVEGVAGALGWRVPPVGSRYISGVQYNGINGTNLLDWRLHEGSADQQVDKYLHDNTALWTSAHRLRGIAYLYLRLIWNSSVWAGGLPNISAVVKGKKVYDPRSGVSGWSDNPALCIRDYLLSAEGLGCSADEIDEESFMAAANLCDELVSRSGLPDEKRYTCNGVFSLDEKPIDIMENLLSSCSGTLVYVQGQYKLYPAAYRAPVLSLDASCLRGDAVIRPLPPRRSRPNTVRGTFVDPARAWQAGDFAPVQNSAYVAADGGEICARELALPFTTSAVMAQRLAQLQLERSRNGLTVELPCTLAALPVMVMEPLRLSIPELGWVDKIMLPTAWQLAPEGGVDLVLVEESAALYAWTGSVNVSAPAPALELPGLYPGMPAMTLSDELVSALLCLVVTVAGTDEAFITAAEVEYRLQGQEAWQVAGQAAGSGSRVLIPGVVAGQVYEVRARLRNTLGLASAWREAVYRITGATEPPGDIASLTAGLVEGTLYLEWARPTGLVERYRLRWSPLTSGASWSSAVDVASSTTTRATLPARLGSYFIKAVDGSGRESPNATAYINLTPETRSSLVVGTLTEHPAFSGARSNAVVNASSQLVIDSLAAFDAQTGNFDSLSGSFDSAGGGTSPEGGYSFASIVDLGQRYVVRASVRLLAGVIDLVSELDSVTGEFDSREGLFDGEAPSAVDVIIEAATTGDDPAATPVWSSWQPVSVGELSGRAFRFRARLLTRNAMATPLVEQLSVTLDMPERVDAAAGLTSSPGGDSITFTPAFKATPAISITPANLAAGEYFTITARSRSGFSVQFSNSSGTGIARQYDWVARGYGREI